MNSPTKSDASASTRAAGATKGALMAFSIMGGLLVGTILTLVFLPTFYVTWFRGNEKPVGT
jgi:multidrug efflux pump subunit AcrB